MAPPFFRLSLTSLCGATLLSGLSIPALVVANTSLDVASADTQILISAGRRPQVAKEVLAASTLITRRQIQQKQYQSVAEALVQVPGLHLASSGGLGKQTSVFIRGANAAQVLVLVDGVRVGSATSGLTAFEQYPIDQIDRIEVIRGPVSGLYGSEAIGGVIHIFTRTSAAVLQQPGMVNRSNARFTQGSHETQQASLGHAVRFGSHQLSAQVSQLNSEGFDSCRAQAFNTGGCFTDEPDADGFDNQAQAFRYHFDNTHKKDSAQAATRFTLQAFNSESDTEFDGDFGNFSKNQQLNLSTQLEVSFAGGHQLELSGGVSEDHSDTFLDALNTLSFKNRFDTKRESAALLYHLPIGDKMTLSLGVDRLSDSIDTITETGIDQETGLPKNQPFAQTQRRTDGHFIQLQNSFDKALIQVNIRNDDNSQYGAYDSWNVRAGYFVMPNLRLSLSAGRGFKAPTFNDLYFPGPFSGSNPDLRLERSDSLELGVEGSSTRFDWSTRLFTSDLKDPITFDSNFVLQNTTLVKNQGLESDIRFDWQQWEFAAQYTFLETENRGGSNEGNWLARRPRHLFHLDASRRVGRLLFGVQLNIEGKRFDDAGNNKPLGGFGTLDLRAEMTVHQSWRLMGNLKNLGGKTYETVQFYRQPETTMMLGVEYRP